MIGATRATASTVATFTIFFMSSLRYGVTISTHIALRAARSSTFDAFRITPAFAGWLSRL